MNSKGRKRRASALNASEKMQSAPIALSDSDFDDRPTMELYNDVPKEVKKNEVIVLSSDESSISDFEGDEASESSTESDEDASMTSASSTEPEETLTSRRAPSSSRRPTSTSEIIELSDTESMVSQPSQAPSSATSKPIWNRKPIENLAAKKAAANVTRAKVEKPKQAAVPKNLSREERQDLMRRRREANVYHSIVSNHKELGELWEEVDLTRYDPMEAKRSIVPVQQPATLSNVKLLPFQLEGIGWMIRQERDPEFHGGILADEMGMGKTIQTIGLFLAEKHKPTLVVCPAVALIQWYDEIKKYTPPDYFKVYIYHGTDRITDTKELMEYDIILTTYAIVEASHRKEYYGFKRKGELVKEKSPIHAIDWYRVTLDEAHSIKDRSSSTARAVYALKTVKKWCLTGTPLQNRVGELYSLLRFLRVDPFAYYFCTVCSCKSLKWDFPDGRHCATCFDTGHQHFSFFNREILKPITAYGANDEAGLVAMRKLNRILDKIMLRRTKVERADDLGLPPRVVVVKKDYFNEEEEDFYTSLFSDAKRKFDSYVAEGTVLNHYASIFELLTKMRQAADHPDLVTKKSLIAANKDADILVCGICQESCEDAIISKCKHTFCREDITQYVNSCAGTPKCPTCLRVLTIDLTQPEIIPKEATTTQAMKSSIINYLDMTRWRSSTKIESLVEELTRLKQKDATIKSIVFSQFVNFLDLVSWRLKRAGFDVVRLDGKMSPSQRAAVIESFNTDPNLTVFLISLKAGGVALNLTSASHVFLLDPWWNPMVAQQGMDRIHRIGQHRPVRITHIVIENSIESKILQLQDKKQLLFDSTVGKDEGALTKLSEEDLGFLFK